MKQVTSPVYAPREVFDQTLEYFPMSTFDLVINVPDRGVLIARRKIAPYNRQWALPGLRHYKGRDFEETLRAIAMQEAGVEIDVDGKRFLGQYDGFFKTEHDRQDISTGYAVDALSSDVTINPEHFTGHRFINGMDELPLATGAMYRFYLEKHFDAQPK
jgi:ADP-ribose pyrophosphatase YjhB (NUDIX family)